ncbi:DUF4350 domain-containing protein [Undibacterium cyanobacteriorum]|uniref:DUF4350 domain-containing protein n=1 Tax=Undibacterium cyanobacteriorum TaxID=3073561 RepID=A0ABY9RID1_9BURK|nr:DUF4350 domain-containing protein [Undibacterium sp. 20NA77.5]WMW80960.1 DUF4350 domain-containing protein [Undibacterium sp. 20NA77.5]
MSGTNTKKTVMGQIEGRDIVYWIIGLLICIGLAFAWYDHMERQWTPTYNLQTEYRKQPMLAAKRLAERNHYSTVTKEHLTLELFDEGINGSLVIANNDGVMSDEQGKALLAWVARGNTLITFPQLRYQQPIPETNEEAKEKKESKKTDSDEDELRKQIQPSVEPAKRRADPTMRDPIGEFLGLYVIDTRPYAKAGTRNKSITYTEANGSAASTSAENGDEEDYYDDEEEALDDESASKVKMSSASGAAQNIPANTPTSAQPSPQAYAINEPRPEDLDQRLSQVTLPHTQRSLLVTRTQFAMLSFKNRVQPIYQVDNGTSLRIYQHGRGKIVALPQNIFGAYSLRNNDNAQFLLDLMSMNQAHKQLIIVKSLKAMHWTELAWARFSYGIIGFGLLIALWIWRVAPRFGSLLSSPVLERRALLEHIDASARWSWKHALGRQNLLDACRRAALNAIKRRAPELLRLPQNDMISQLAQQTGLDANSLANACFDAASSNPLQFTRQIQLLQRLRTHYER